MSTFTKTVIVDPSDPNYPNTIQDGLAELNDQGGVVYVESGEYEIGSSNDTIEVPSNTTIIGRGNVVLNVVADFPAFRNKQLLPIEGRITISGFKIVVCEEATPYHNHLISMINVENCILEKLTITVEGSQGIYQFFNPDPPPPTEQYAAIWLYASYGQSCLNNKITQCHIYDYGKTYNGSCNYGFGILLTSAGTCSGNIIKNNYVSQCLDGCYLLNASNNIICNNIITKSAGIYPAGIGILVEISDSTIIKGNQIHENNDHGIYLSGCKHSIVEGNVVAENHDAGIHVRFAGEEESPIKDEFNSIIGNVFYKNDGSNNPFSPGKANGIHLQAHAQWNTIVGNSCVDNTANGIRIQTEDIEEEEPVLIAPDNIVVGNVCIRHAAPYNSDLPISIDDPSNCCADNKTGSL